MEDSDPRNMTPEQFQKCGTDRTLLKSPWFREARMNRKSELRKGEEMPAIQVFDKPLCCSSGVCGPDVDPALVTFAADLQWLEQQGVEVQRINPAHQPTLFAENRLVREELTKHGNDCLPLVVVNDAVVSRGVFPNRNQLAGWSGIKVSSLPELAVVKTGCCGDTKGTSGSSSSCC
jgi:Arsenical resistance operon protein ArsD